MLVRSKMQKAMTDTGAFIFDFFGVMASFDNDIVYARLARHCRNPADAFDKLNGVMASRDVITDRLTLPQIHERLVKVYGLSLDYAEFECAWCEPYSKPIPGMAELVKALTSNYTVLLLSNVDRHYWDSIRTAHPELECFDALILSFDVGMAKPEPAIFLHASEVAGVELSRCFFVDDTLANIDAARTLNFRTHWFKCLPGLLNELTQINTMGVYPGFPFSK